MVLSGYMGIGVFGQVLIQNFVKREPQLLRPKVANVEKWYCASKVSHLWLGSWAYLRTPEAFEFSMLKYAFSHILETLFISFLTAISTPKTDKNSTLHCTSINFRSFMLFITSNHRKTGVNVVALVRRF